MNVVPRHAGKVNEKGELVLADPSAWRGTLARHRNRNVWLTVSRQQQLKTMSQGRYYWGVVVRDIADYIGESRDTTHEYLKAMHLPTRHVELLDGQVLQMPATTKTLTVEEFSAYIERCRVWAAQFLGLSIPSPGEVEVL